MFYCDWNNHLHFDNKNPDFCCIAVDETFKYHRDNYFNYCSGFICGKKMWIASSYSGQAAKPF